MPFTTLEVQRGGLHALNDYMRNVPIDQIAIERPFLKKLMGMKKKFGGGKQYVVENIRYRYQSNFQWFRGDQQVTYNKRQTVKHANFEYTSAHDGYTLNEDDFAQNSIIVADTKPKNSSKAERIQLYNMFDEQNSVLREGFEEQFDLALHQDGTAATEAIQGLDFLIPTNGLGTVGGIDSSAAADSYWRPTVATGVAQANLITTMESTWRSCIRNGGRPDFIMAGSDFVDTFRAAAKGEISRYSIVKTTGGQSGFDPSVGPVQGVDTGLHFQNVPIIWNPVFEELDGSSPPTVNWEDRCYFINCKHIRLRPMEGHDMVTRNPPRVYDRYAYYWGLTWKGALCTNRRNAHALLSVQ